MTDRELVEAIRKIVTARDRRKDKGSDGAAARDLARYDQIAGLIARHPRASVTDAVTPQQPPLPEGDDTDG